MSKWQRDLTNVLDSFGVLKSSRVSHTRNGHLRIDIDDARPIFAASTPSDYRALKNVRADIKRRLRARTPLEQPEPLPEQVSVVAPSLLPEPIPLPPKPLPHRNDDLVWHHTCSVHLVNILIDGELRPPDNDVLWSTSDSNMDKLSTLGTGHYSGARNHFCAGALEAVRITCDRNAFRNDWTEAPRATNKKLWWTVPELQRHADHYRQNTNVWFWRSHPLPINETLIERRSYRRNFWTPVDNFEVIDLFGDRVHAVRIGDLIYFSWIDDEGDLCFRTLHASSLPQIERRMELVHQVHGRG